MPASQLKTVLMPLLRHLRVDVQQLNDSGGYVIETGNGITLQFEESPTDCLTLSCLLPMREADFSDPVTLNTLLQCNLLGLAHPPVLTATLPEDESVLLWTRLPYSMMEPHQLLALFERFQTQAEKMKAYLALPSETAA